MAKKVDYYALGASLCTDGGREFVYLLAQRRKQYLAELLDPKPTDRDALVHTIKAIDSMKATMDKALDAYISASHARLPDWKRDELYTNGALREGGEDE
jgi:hypothetical protein